ncbi:MAG: pitrilysin family protein [Polyangia bacterium]|jgi:zinc protease|nr:pitrilysin family protein [Polyangia bacterium]
MGIGTKLVRRSFRGGARDLHSLLERGLLLNIQLKNGLRVLVLPTSAAPVVALQAWVGVGSAHEALSEAGAAHFLEHMLFKGTHRRGVGELAKEVEAAGGDINAWTEFNNTVYHLVLGSRFLDLGLDILADAVQNPTLDPEEVERERQVILEEIQQGEDDPHRVNFQQLFSLVFGRHPYGRPVIGLRETVAAMGASDLRRFHRAWYAPGNITFVVAGDVDQSYVVGRVKAAFRSRGRETPGSEPRSALPKRGPRVAIRYAPVREAYLLLGLPVPGLLHEDVPAIDLAATLLGQGDSSRLSRRLLRERRLVTDVSSYAFTPHDVGLFTLGATLEPDKLEEAVGSLVSEAFSLGSKPAGRDEVDKARVLTESSAIFQAETAPGIARRAGFYQYTANDPDYEATYLAKVREVTPESLRRALGRQLAPSRLSLALVLPEAAVPRRAREGLPARLRVLCEESGRGALEGRASVLPPPGRGGTIRTVLPNGLRLLVKPDPTIPLVAFRAAWMGGLRNESSRSNGINNLISNLLTRGTASRSGDEIVEQVERMAGSIGGFTGRNSLGIRLETLSHFWRESLDIFADCLLNPLFPEEEVARERDLALQEIATRDDSLTGVAFRLFQKALYRDHPYRLNLGGETASVSRLDVGALRRYFGRHCQVGDLVLTVVGDVDPESVAGEVARLLGRPRRRPSPEIAPPQEPNPRSPKAVSRSMERQQAHLVLGFLGTSILRKDRFALEVLATVLSGQGGRLFLHIRDRLGLVYRISAFTMEGIDPGYFAVYAATSPEQVGTLVSEIRAALGRLRNERVPKSELKRAKRFLLGHHDLTLQQRTHLASTLTFNELYGLGYEAHLKYSQSILAVTAEDLVAVARRYLAPRREVLATVLPETSGRKEGG